MKTFFKKINRTIPLLEEGPGRPMDPQKKKEVERLGIEQVYGNVWFNPHTKQRYLWIKNKKQFDPIETRGRGRPAMPKPQKAAPVEAASTRRPSTLFAHIKTMDEDIPPMSTKKEFDTGSISPESILQHPPAGSNPNFLQAAKQFLSSPTQQSAQNLIRRFDITVKDNGALRAGKRSGLKELERYLLGKRSTRESLAFMEFLKKVAGGLPRDPSQITKAEPALSPKQVFQSAAIESADIEETGDKISIKIGENLSISANKHLATVPLQHLAETTEWKKQYAQSIQSYKDRGAKMDGSLMLFRAKQRADRKTQMIANVNRLILSISEMKNDATGKFDGKVIVGGSASINAMRSDITAALSLLRDVSASDKVKLSEDITKLSRVGGGTYNDVLRNWNILYSEVQSRWETTKNFDRYLVGFCESLSALLCKKLGASAVIVPNNPATKLGDVIAIYENQQIDHSAKGLDVVVDFVSVKKDGGGGGSALPRAELSAFRTTRKISGLKTKEKILEMLSQDKNGVFARLFYSSDAQSAFDHADADLERLWEDYDDVIFKHVGFSIEETSNIISSKASRKTTIRDIKNCWRNGGNYKANIGCTRSDAITLLQTGCASKNAVSKTAHMYYFEYGMIIESLMSQLTVGQAWSTHIHKSHRGVQVSTGGLDVLGEGKSTMTGTQFQTDKKPRPNGARNDGSCVPSTQFPMKSSIVDVDMDDI